MVDFQQHCERRWVVLEEDHVKVEKERDHLRVEVEALRRDAGQDWGVFAGHLLDNCERQEISEESLQRWMGDMLADPHYGALFRREKMPHPSVAEAIAQQHDGVGHE